MDFKNLQLLCIPFSGGNAYSYTGFRKFLPADINLINLELPGRGKRINEPLLYNIAEMTEDLYRQAESFINDRYIIYGHSLGALLGIELCRHIAEKKGKLPLRLFLSGQTSPRLIKPDNKHNLPDDQFIDMLRVMNGTPEELLSDKGFTQFFLPVVRADFQSIANYKYTPKTCYLDVPITIMLGNDENISDAEASGWQYETDSTVSIYRFEGGHFFIFQNESEICSLFTEQLKNDSIIRNKEGL